ncbi:hypothetical protein GOV09_07010 [Candidatus Woesearchaeota archaeon]|nr:hypothetical protein [Candidatus Woesearchaeota archaeon]
MRKRIATLGVLLAAAGAYVALHKADTPKQVDQPLESLPAKPEISAFEQLRSAYKAAGYEIDDKLSFDTESKNVKVIYANKNHDINIDGKVNQLLELRDIAERTLQTEVPIKIEGNLQDVPIPSQAEVQRRVVKNTEGIVEKNKQIEDEIFQLHKEYAQILAGILHDNDQPLSVGATIEKPYRGLLEEIRAARQIEELINLPHTNETPYSAKLRGKAIVSGLDTERSYRLAQIAKHYSNLKSIFDDMKSAMETGAENWNLELDKNNEKRAVQYATARRDGILAQVSTLNVYDQVLDRFKAELKKAGVDPNDHNQVRNLYNVQRSLGWSTYAGTKDGNEILKIGDLHARTVAHGIRDQGVSVLTLKPK